MSIVISSGGTYNLILGKPTARGQCSYPIQASLGMQILPGLPPPGSPDEFDVILDLLKPTGMEIAFEGAPATPMEFGVIDTTAPGAPPAMPGGFIAAETDLPPAAPVGLMALELGLVEVAPPDEFTVASVDPPPEMPVGLFLVDTDPPPGIPVGLEAVIAGAVVVGIPESFDAVDLDPRPARPARFLVDDADPPPAMPTGLFGVDVPKVAVPEGFAVQLPPVPGC